MTDDLVAFLRARLDEDEQTARHATDGPWADPLGGPIRGGYEERFVIAQQAQRWNSQHIVRHDPARVLAEVDAKRRIVVGCESAATAHRVAAEGTDVHELMKGSANSMHYVLRLLALPYADHPDYRDEWRP